MKRTGVWLGCFLSLASCAWGAEQAVPAFPGAEGFGAVATGGRGGRVLVVDSTADDPKNPAPGTLRWACEVQEGPRIVVFQTAGVIELSRSVVVTNPNLTVAAQSAPGDGICLRGSSLSIEADNVIVRGLRSRPGDGKIGTPGQYRHALTINGPVSRVIFDHCSLSWAVDGSFQAYGDKAGHAPSEFTLQYCLLSEGLHHSIHAQGDHSCAVVLGGGSVRKFTFSHNLLAHHHARNPRIVWGATGEFVNNVIYDWGGQSMILEPFNPTKVKRDKRRPDEKEIGAMRLNIIGNTWLLGPSSRDDKSEIRIQHAVDGTRIYLHDNVGPNRPAGSSAGENEIAIVGGKREVFSAEQPAVESSGLKIQSAAAAKADVLQFVGAIVPLRDEVDRRVVDQVRQGAGRIIDSPNDVGGYPNYRAASLPADADKDGMPDAWEIAHGLDPSKADGAGRKLDPNYDNLEVYLNGLFPAPSSGDGAAR